MMLMRVVSVLKLQPEMRLIHLGNLLEKVSYVQHLRHDETRPRRYQIV